MALRAVPDALAQGRSQTDWMNMRVVIVDDHARFREQAGMLLELEKFDVVGNAQTAHEGVEVTRLVHPDFVLLDIGLPDSPGFDIVPALHHEGAAVVLTSSRGRRDYGQRVDESGAEGFISKADLSGDAIRSLLK